MFLGELISEFRAERDLTMQQFADLAGLSKAYISMLEKNQHPQSKRPLVPSIATCAKIAHAMSISLDELMSALNGDQSIHLGAHNNDENNSLSDQEDELISLFRQLNDEGQEKLIDNCRDLVASGRYIKNNESDLVDKKEA